MTITRRDLVATSLALGALPTAAFAAVTQAECQRLANGELRLSWQGPAVEIRQSEQPDGPFNRVVARRAAGAWTGAAPISPRPYFRLAGRAGATEVAERVLPLEGGRNFRDLGGYRGAEGRMVRWGVLYRSGSMVDLTPADYAYLSKLGVQVICDFRTTTERSQEPTVWQGAHAPALLSRDYDPPKAAPGAPTPPALTAAAMRARMLKSYEELPYQQADSYRRMFAELVAGRTPLAFHCSAGKDRTGIAAALLLTTLGVSHDQVLADYALTNKVMDYEAVARRSTKGPAGYPEIMKLPADVRGVMMTADPAYLEAAFAAMTRREGSVAAFMRERVGVSTADTAVLRRRLLKRV